MLADSDVKKGALLCLRPLHAMALPIPEALFLETSKATAQQAASRASKLSLKLPFRDRVEIQRGTSIEDGWFYGGTARPLRIGYMSSDFKAHTDTTRTRTPTPTPNPAVDLEEHPVAQLISSVFGFHRKRPDLEAYAYALRPGDGSKWRHEIEAGLTEI